MCRKRGRDSHQQPITSSNQFLVIKNTENRMNASARISESVPLLGFNNTVPFVYFSLLVWCLGTQDRFRILHTSNTFVHWRILWWTGWTERDGVLGNRKLTFSGTVS